MSASFVIEPRPGHGFDPAAVRRVLARHPAVVEERRLPDSYVFAGEAAESQAVAEAIEADPDRPHWVVFLSVRPAGILVYREAYAEVLSAFRPVLADLLATLPCGRVVDEEGRPIPAPSREALVATLTT